MATTIAAKISAAGQPKRKSARINVFHQRLASLTYHQACQLLGDEGSRLLREGSRQFEVQSDRDVYLGGDLFRVRVLDASADDGVAITTITLHSGRKKQLLANCTQCETPCTHIGAAVDFLLDARSVLGLAAPPDESVALENLTPSELHHRMLADRAKRAKQERMTVRSTNTERPWTDYVVTSEATGRTYRVALRGRATGDSYCSCPDFRTNLLGTCKHILHVLAKVEKRFSAAKLRAPYHRKHVSLRVHYELPLGVRFNLPTNCDDKLEELAGGFDVRSICSAQEAMDRIGAIEEAGYDVRIYPDAEDFIQRQLVQSRLKQECDAIRADVDNHPLRTQLLSAKLLPYQLDGIAFAVGAGRAILADDMGLGKTIQGIGVAELLAQQADIRRVLVVCPASLKSQWRSEITKFCGRSVQLIAGSGAERVEQYGSDTFFTICNYEQVLRDLSAVESVSWDLIILDEGQRIKNYESKTSNVIRMLESPFRLVLSGTPLENRLGELFTVARFVDEHQLGPAYQFFKKYHVVDDHGKTLAYQNLDELRETLRPILLRRTRAEVAKQLPDRTDEIVRIAPTAEQLEIHDGQIRVVAQIIGKKYFTEMDRLRLQKALLLARMSADSTFLVDKEEPEYSTKLERLGELLDGLIEDPTRKIVLFSEWRRMLDRIEKKLDAIGCDYVRLDGQVPQKKRPQIVAKFQNDPDCRVILMTNAGSTGLNLQAANTVINVDLPWNPAVLEQRIARAYRMGQKNPVHIYKLVTVDTIEERLLETLASKQDLADAALDFDSDVESVAMVSGMEDLKRRLEKMIGPAPPAPVDQSQQRRVEQEVAAIQHRKEKVSEAGGQLIGAALALAGELIGRDTTNPPPDQTVIDLTNKLAECVDRDEQGQPQLTIKLPNEEALRSLAMTLARLLG